VSDLVQRQVSVIFGFGAANSVRAAKAATARIPIAFANGGDAVALGLVASIISRPGGNVTGVRFLRVLILDLLGVLVLTWEMEIPNARSCRCSSPQKL
jgi:ABC transporter substrate binding protein